MTFEKSKKPAKTNFFSNIWRRNDKAKQHRKKKVGQRCRNEKRKEEWAVGEKIPKYACHHVYIYSCIWYHSLWSGRESAWMNPPPSSYQKGPQWNKSKPFWGQKQTNKCSDSLYVRVLKQIHALKPMNHLDTVHSFN